MSNERPLWVPETFAGKCKVFPERKALMLPFQRRWIEDESRLKLAQKSRQIGWTWCTGYRIVSTKSMRDARLDAWISSRDEIQARLFLEDCKSFAQLLNTGAKDLGERVIDENKNSAFVLSFANGLRANSMSSNPDAQAGKRGDRVLDEFALHPDPRKLYSIAYPGITWGGGLEIFSTHRGTDNYFNTLITEVLHKGNPKGFSLHTVTLQDALDQGFLFKLQLKLPEGDPRQQMDEADYFNMTRAQCPDEETFQQEYMCQPSDDSAAFLSYDLIAGCVYPPTESWEMTLDELARTENPLYIGVDVGRKHDLTVMWALESVAGVNLTRRVVVCEKETFSAQEAKLNDLLRLPSVRRCCIDNTGVGMQFAERAQERFGEYRVEAVTFSAPVKEELAYPVRAAFEDRSIRIPGDRKTEADLRGIRKEQTASGNVRFAGERGENGHCDRFWALALALHAKGNIAREFAWQTVKTTGAGGRRGDRGMIG